MWDPLNMHLGIYVHCDLKTCCENWPAAFSIMFHHFPMISHVILHLHIIFPQRNPKITSKATSSPSLCPGPDVLRSFSSTPDVAGASLWVGLSGHGDLATESLGWTSQCLEERPGDGCGEDPRGMIFIGGDTPITGDTPIARWMVYWCLFHGKFQKKIDDLEVPPFRETSIWYSADVVQWI